jgi:transposase
MGGRFDGLSDLEWQLFADIFPPPPPRQGPGMPYTPFRQVVNPLLDVLITGCRWCDLPHDPPMGVQKCGPSGAAAVANRWHARGYASPDPRDYRGTRDDSVAVRRRRWLFALAKAAVRIWLMEAKGKGASFTVSPTRLACPWPTIQHWPMAMSGPRCSRCWTPSASGLASLGVRANAPKCWRPTRAMTPRRCACNCANAAFGRRYQNVSGRPRERGAAHQDGCPPLPGRAYVCLVSEKVPPLGRPLGAACGLLYGVSGHRHDPYLDPKIDRGTGLWPF